MSDHWLKISDLLCSIRIHSTSAPSAPLRQKRTSHCHPFARSVSVRGSKSLAPPAKRTTLKRRPGKCSVLIFRLFRLFRRPPSPAHPSSNEQPSNSDPDQNFSTSFHFSANPTASSGNATNLQDCEIRHTKSPFSSLKTPQFSMTFLDLTSLTSPPLFSMPPAPPAPPPWAGQPGPPSRC